MSNKKPVKNYKHGRNGSIVEAAIWENQGSSGSFHTVTFKRRYKDGEEWMDAQGFTFFDLVNLIRCAVDANAWLHAESNRSEERAAA